MVEVPRPGTVVGFPLLAVETEAVLPARPGIASTSGTCGAVAMACRADVKNVISAFWVAEKVMLGFFTTVASTQNGYRPLAAARLVGVMPFNATWDMLLAD